MNIAMLKLSLILAASLCSQVVSPSSQIAKPENPQETLASLQGGYYQGDGLGSNMHLNIESYGKFSSTSFADVGYRHRYEGTVEIVQGLLIFKVEKSVPPEARDHFSHSKLRPIRWGKRSYLLSERQFLNFCNAINLGIEPRDRHLGDFYVRLRTIEQSRKGAEAPEIDGQVDGKPDLPGVWRPFLLDKPLRGQVTEVLKEGRATIDIGSEEGFKEGMRLMVWGEKQEAGPIHRHYGIVKVVSIETHRSTVKFTRPEFSPDFKQGQNVSSRISKAILDEESPSFFWYDED